MKNTLRIKIALGAALVHLLCSFFVAALAALIVFGFWYPFPYREISGGRELFILIVSVDVVCGPLLTLVLFNPQKPRIELWRDLTLVALIQISALFYGMHTVWQARPIFLVMEVDRFKTIAAADVDAVALETLPAVLKPKLFSGPILAGLREPKDKKEQQTVLFESIQGGRDYAERPEFYVPYSGAAALKSLERAKPLSAFLNKEPLQKATVEKLAAERKTDISQWFYLPVMARKEWVAIIDKKGDIQGFLPGDGF